jgi:hypothetical protein
MTITIEKAIEAREELRAHRDSVKGKLDHIKTTITELHERFDEKLINGDNIEQGERNALADNQRLEQLTKEQYQKAVRDFTEAEKQATDIINSTLRVREKAIYKSRDKATLDIEKVLHDARKKIEKISNKCTMEVDLFNAEARKTAGAVEQLYLGGFNVAINTQHTEMTVGVNRIFDNQEERDAKKKAEALKREKQLEETRARIAQEQADSDAECDKIIAMVMKKPADYLNISKNKLFEATGITPAKGASFELSTLLGQLQSESVDAFTLKVEDYRYKQQMNSRASKQHARQQTKR